MRTYLLALATLALTAAALQSADQQGNAPCNCPKCQAARAAEQKQVQQVAAPQQQAVCNCAKCQAARAAAQQEQAQVAYQQQAAFYAQQQAMAGGVQPAGYGMTGAFPANGHPYGPPRHSYSPDAPHPGRPFDGGWYGWHGSPHGTPGYPHAHHRSREYVGPQGPPTGAVAYPYYTTRGPRDFLVDNPPSIGR
jgi:hypothetical protein